MNWFDKFSFKHPSSRFVCFVGEGGGAPSGGDAGGGSSPAPSGTPPGDGGGAGSSTPTTPGAGDTNTPSEPSEPSEFSFDGLDSDLDSIEIQDESSTGTDPGATPAPDSAATPPAVVPPAATTPSSVPPQATPAPAPAATAPSAPQSKREELDSAIAGFKDGFEDLAKWAQTEMFTLSQEDLDALATDAPAVIPTLMAKTYTRAVLASLNFIKNYVPEMIAQEHTRLNGVAKRTSEAENEFWTTWPDLNKEAHGAAMAQTAKVFRSLNPQASRKEAIDYVGRYLMTQFGVAPRAPGAARPAKAVPFQPARPGGHVPSSPPAKDPYAGMDVDFD